VYDFVIPSGSEVDGTVVIGQITMTTGATFGKFVSASEFAAKTAAGVWGSFDISEVTTCSTTIQLKGDTSGATSFVVDETAAVSTVAGNDVYVGYATATANFDGYTDATKPCSGVILSVASAIVSFIAFLF